MPAGHTDAEYALFTKTERRILHMIFDLKFDRVQIKNALEITDSSFRFHIANIKRKQAEMRRKKAEVQISENQQRQAEKFLPELEQEILEAEESRPREITFERTGPKGNTVTRRAHNNEPLTEILSPSSDAPILRPVSVPPSAKRENPFVEMERRPAKDVSDRSAFRIF